MTFVRRIRLALVWALGLLLVSAAVSAAPSTSSSVDVTRATLSNGLRIVVLRDRLAPVVSTFLNYQVGSNDESITGLAHASEHMMFRGSTTLSASQFSDITAIAGGNYNANTQSEITQYFFTMPAQDLDVALRLEASRARGLLMTQPLWDQERGAIEQEVTRDNSDAGYRLYVQVLHHVFEGTPYADEGLGTLQSFGMCLDTAGGGTQQGTLTVLNTCNGSGTQVWTPGTNGRLVNQASGLCLDDPGSNTNNGAQLQIWPCNGGSNQHWWLPEV